MFFFLYVFSYIDYKKNTSENIYNTYHYRSSTTNSYNKCIHELASKFPPEVEQIAINAVLNNHQNYHFFYGKCDDM
jgi:hypothetical protein